LTPTIKAIHYSPSNLWPVYPAQFPTLMEAKKLLFYYNGGKQVLSIYRNHVGDFEVFVPQFASITDMGAVQYIQEQQKEILDEMEALKIEPGVSFFYDVNTKSVVEPDNFIDFIPYFNIKSAIFTMEDANGAGDGRVRYLANTDDYGVLQFLMAVIAKRELHAPVVSPKWTAIGKQLLAFLTSKKYSRPGDFRYESGCWNSVDFPISKEKQLPIPIDLSKMKLNRVIAMVNNENKTLLKALPAPVETAGTTYVNQTSRESTTMSDEDMEEYTAYLKDFPTDMFQEDAESGITLCELLEIGVDSFFNGDYKDIIDVQIDILGDMYSKIILDTNVGICFVCLNPGIEKSQASIKEEFQSDHVQVVPHG
jgi:hypothetical protein